MNQIDMKICSFVCLMFFCLQLDRGNITQALSDNMLSDLGMSTNQYNTGQTIFYLSFLCAELPSQMLSKKLGPDVCTLSTQANFLLLVYKYLQSDDRDSHPNGSMVNHIDLPVSPDGLQVILRDSLSLRPR